MTLDDLRGRDAADPLRAMHDAFDLPQGVIYLDGNSLGALPHVTKARMADAVAREWGEGLVRSWNTAGWIDAGARIGGRLAGLIGAQPHETIVADSTSVNLFKLLEAALTDRPGRRVILSEPGNFPTDLYVAQGVAAMLPDVELRTVPRDRIIEAIDDSVAVVMLTHVHYRTGERFDMAALTGAAHDAGALALWDLSHSVGAIAVDLNGADADLAVGCGYKYLNGGPGAPAFLFVAERHQARMRSALSGWMGHARPFAFGDDYAPAPDMRRFLCGTPPILSMAALEAGVELFLTADRDALFAKGQALCSTFIDLVDQRCEGLGLTLATPRDPALRGSHVSFVHDGGFPVMQALIARGVIGDFRAPDILRFGLTPLYVGFEDVWNAVETLRDILVTRSWDDERYRVAAAVT
ncbi:MAG: kynureninase [Sphingomonadales bacterium]